MSEKGTVASLKNPANFGADPLNELLKDGAKSLIKKAIEIEIQDYLERYESLKTSDGRRAVVKNGYLPEREIQTGIGPVSVRIPKVRSRSDENFIFNSTLIPPYVSVQSHTH